ncbi:hypothetical protein scyTo_0003237 [Scyliorhinus torazame]|uniref:Uncharacterized protein n=1 Tax=Scyliorhinus torazame TaxID=75743 RepID=A0A401PLZ4_SCYTO|nr:hypothetical protein [Scyliorhinus torazame]
MDTIGANFKNRFLLPSTPKDIQPDIGVVPFSGILGAYASMLQHSPILASEALQNDASCVQSGFSLRRKETAYKDQQEKRKEEG